MKNFQSDQNSASGFLSTTGFQATVLPIVPDLVRFARRLTGNGSEGDDLVQDTLLNAWRGRRSYSEGTNIRAWLLRIARNRFLSGRRRAGRQVLWADEAIERALVVAPEQEQHILCQELEAALERLPIDQRSAFDLTVCQGFKEKEAASQLGVCTGTVRSRTARAKAAIIRSIDVGPGEKIASKAAALPAPPEKQAQSTYERWKASGGRWIG